MQSNKEENNITRYKLHKVKTKWVTIGTTLCGSILAISAINGNANADSVDNIKQSNTNSEQINNQSEVTTSQSLKNDNSQKTQTQINSSNNDNDIKSLANSNSLSNDLNEKDNSSINNSNKETDNKLTNNLNNNQAGDIKANNQDVNNSATTANNSSSNISAEQTAAKSNVQINNQASVTQNNNEKNIIPEANYNSNQQNNQNQVVTNNNFAAVPQAKDAQSEITYGSCNDLNQLDITLKDPLQGDIQSQVQFNNGNGIKSVTQNGNHLTIVTNGDIDFQKAMTVIVNGQSYTIDPTDGTQMPVVRSQAFDNKYTYNGDNLGATYSNNQTTWKVWAPTASGMSLNIFQNDKDPKAPLKEWKAMNYDPNTGVWSITLDGDYKDTAYDFNEEFANGKAYEIYDPYATACVEGGFRSVVLSPDEIGGNVTAGKVVDKDDPTDEVIGEIHIRDFTNDPSSGVDSNIRGTYLGVVQEGTKNANGQATGLDYLKQQSINTVQIQPMYQYDDDGNNTNTTYQYDWGYDPENYNIPEGWYSTNRDDPATRIKECKEMVQKLHDNGIRVNMDVVYNHVADTGTNALAKVVPGYYFRYGNNGKMTNASACGNDVASERNMVRNYILHSIKYWHDVYGIDGFRFDLMGNLDVTTMNDIRKELPNVVLYGEGWNMGASISDSDKADQANEPKMPTIGSFNGWGRTVLRGDDNGKPYGYITGNQSQQTMSQLGNFIYGCQNQKNTPSDAVDGGVNYVNPGQVINYTECHDNKTLFDVMKAAHPEESDDVLMRRAELGNAINILNEGVPFLQVGQGFGRTKQGDGNSYRSGDKINNINWNLESKFPWAVTYEKALLQLRNSDPAFRMTSFNDMNNNMKWVEIGSNNGVIGYELTSPSTGKKYIIAYSNNQGSQQLTGIPNGNWNVLIKNCNGYLDNPQKVNITNGSTDIPSLSCLVLEQDPQQKSTINVTYQDANGNKVGNYSNTQDGNIDAEKVAEQHIPSGYHFVKGISVKGSQNVKDGINYNEYNLIIEVAKDQSNTSKPNDNTNSSSQSGSPSSSQTTPTAIYTVTYKTSDGNVVGSATTKDCKDYASFCKDNCPKGYHIVKIISTTSSSDHPANVPYTIGSVYEVAKDQTSTPSQSGSSSSSNTNDNTSTNKPSSNTGSSNEDLPSASILNNLKSIYNLTLHNAEGTNKDETYPAKVVDYQGKLYITDNNGGVYKLSDNDKYDIAGGNLFENGSMITSDGNISAAPYTTNDFGKIKPTSDNEIYLGYGNDYKVIGNHIVPTKEEIDVRKGPDGKVQLSIWSGGDPSGRISDDGKGHIQPMLLDGSQSVLSKNTTYSIASNGDVILTTDGKTSTLTHNLLNVHGESNTNSKPSDNTNDVGSVVDKPVTGSNTNSNESGGTSDNKNNNNVNNNTNKDNSSGTTNSDSSNVNNSTNTATDINKGNSSNNVNNKNESPNTTSNDKNSSNSINNSIGKNNSSKIDSTNDSFKMNSSDSKAEDVDADKSSATNEDEKNSTKENSAASSKDVSSQSSSSNENRTKFTGTDINSETKQSKTNNKEVNNKADDEVSYESINDKSSLSNNSQIGNSSNSSDLPQTGDAKDEIIIGSLLSLGLLGMIKLKKND